MSSSKQAKNTAQPKVRNPAGNPEGAVVIIVALSMTVLLGFSALAIDSGYQGVLRAQLQNIADASAHAGALSLDLTAEGIDRARASANHLAAANELANQSYILENDEFEVGIWDYATGTFTADASDPGVVNAVKVTPKYTINPLMMNILSPEIKLKGQATTVAARAPVGGGCALPIAIPSCVFDGKVPSDICGMDLVFNADGVDSAGWANLGDAQPNAAGIRAAISEAADGICEFNGDSSIDTDALSLNNGTVANAVKQVTAAIETSSTTWNASTLGSLPPQDPKSSIRWNRYGNTLEGLIYVYEDPNNCSGTKFTGQVEFSGYAKAVIYDAVDSGNVSQRKLKARLSCESIPASPGSPSAGFYGLLGDVAIVQ